MIYYAVQFIVCKGVSWFSRILRISALLAAAFGHVLNCNTRIRDSAARAVQTGLRYLLEVCFHSAKLCKCAE